MKNFNNNWQFKLETETEWKPVQIPHDWLISDTNNLYKNSIGQYRKFFNQETQADRLYLHFDGVYMDSTLYVNGQEAGQWKNGYTAFYHDITSFVKQGENEILLTVNYQSPNTRWYSGAGIYRDCRLIEKNETHFAIDGIYIKTKNTGEIDVDAEVISPSNDYEVHHRIIGESSELKNPILWDIENPHCYILESQITVKGKITDTVHTRFGFRTIEYTTDKGFYLNGRQVKIKGVCQHHDLGALGAAVNKNALRRQLNILRKMGVNAIRTAHNPPAAVFMELADEMGFLVMSELTDIWKRPKTKYDYARFFEEWSERDVAAWIKRDRNCPSIIMWSIGNEIYDTQADFNDGSTTMKKLMSEVKKHDPHVNAPYTLCSNYMLWESTQKCADIIKLIGYNYGDNLYHKHHEQFSDWIIYGGETAAVVQSRGIYHFPLKKALLADDDLQCSDLGNSATSWGAKSAEAGIINHQNADFTLGQFIWTGTDYIGEPTPYHTKNSYFGQIDTAGFPKDSFYIYKAAWTCGEKEPFVHLLPYWDWSPNQIIDVRIISNCPKVELFLNEKSMGTTTLQDGKLTADFSVPYQPGQLKAMGYNKKGEAVAQIVQNSFTDTTDLSLTSETIGDLTFTEISAIDEKGNHVANANNRIKINVSSGQILGLDNGDSTDYDQYQNTNSRRLFSGKLLAITTAGTEIKAELDHTDIPIRKIELIRTGNTIKAKIHPQNATYSDMEWRLADEAGIDSFLGRLEISPCGTEATLQPKGDGEVYVRCSTKNGKSHINLISLLPITITGYGKPFLDPYEFISGGLYTHSNVQLTNGNERGVATPRDGESHVGFADLDFGEVGSDEVTLWLFPFGNDFPIDIWLGMPNDSTSRKLTTVTYHGGMIWNTYVPTVYKLPERLTGIQTLCVVVNLKVHIKGFQFTAKSKGFEVLNFADNNHIYGDTFNINHPAVESIGNNVTITFNHMNFEKPAKAINITWRTKQDKNTIKLVFTNAEGVETVNMLTLEQNGQRPFLPPTSCQENYSQTTLNLENPLVGKGSVNFIFLPGVNIDLEKFKFEN